MTPRFATAFFVLLCIFSNALAEEISFNNDVRPILTEHCFACHGADQEAREADLRLDEREVAIAAGAILPKSPQQSELVRRILTDDPDDVMPPKGHTALTRQQKETLKNWILQGAEYESHWAFTPPKVRTPQGMSEQTNPWARNPIDHYVFARMREHALTPAKEASRHALVRRLYLDLIGLPPTAEQTHAFVTDDSEHAYERLVDTLLASQHFGEHWAKMWLDLARYADTKGYEKDNHRDIWRFRDWVIDAFNADMPYSEFTRQQIAGDLLPDASSDQLLATAFHRNTMTNDEGGTDNEEFRSLAVKDRVDTTMQVWMGLTMGCAKCHSHKYDPISQTEYYQFYAFFNQTEDADRSDEEPKALTPRPEQAERIEALREKLAAFGEQIDRLGQSHPISVQLKVMHGELQEELKAEEKATPRTPVMRELKGETRRQTHVHIRGNFLEKGDQVSAATPSAFGTFPNELHRDRRGVAEWLTQDTNPLAHRVAVNRVWARIFGVGLVETEEDFGTQGSPPSHPGLLDWLAIQFRDELDGSHKKLCKLIVMSATYRQSSLVDTPKREIDPNNRWLSRAPRFRLAAETIRDQALVTSGLLSREIGGPSVMPPQPNGIWRATYSSAKWKNADNKDRYRRGLYTYWRRTSPYPSMLTFDAGSREVCLIRRIRTNIPLQALITMNDPVFVEASGALARTVLESKFDQTDEKLSFAFQRVLVRPPTTKELDRLHGILQDALVEYAHNEVAARALVSSARLETNLDPAEVAAWTIVANVLLNLDEVLMRN